MSTPASSIRLDFFEEIFCRGYLDSGDGLGAISLRLSGLLDEAAFRRAADHLQVLHPGFRSHLVDRDPWIEWIVSPPGEAQPIPLEFVDCAAAVLPWEANCAAMFDEGLDFTQGHMGRIRVLRNLQTRQSELVLVGHHLVLNGNAGISLFHDLLSCYEQLLEDPERPPPVPQPLRHSSETRLRVPLKSYFRFVPWYIRNARMARQATHILPQGAAPTRDPSLWERHEFSARETMTLVRLCRGRQSTLLGLLMAGGLSALHRVLGEWDLCFQCTAPLDLHHAFVGADGPLHPHEHGSFIGRFSVYTGMKSMDEFWDVARRFSREANHEWKSGCPAIIHRLLTNPATRFVCLPWLPNPKRLEKRYPGRGRATLNISNTGVAPFQERYGPVKVDAVGIAMQQRVRGANLKLNSIVVNNRLNLNVVPWQGLDPEFVRSFRTEFIRQMVELAADMGAETRSA